MTLETFFAKFDLFADAPNALARLRELVFQWAVQGKLLPQDPKDEPAATLLASIETEKSHRLRTGTLRNLKPTAPISDEEKEFELPANWEWIRMGQVVKLWNGFAFKSGDFQENGIPVIRIGDLQRGLVDASTAVCVSEDFAKTVGQEFWIPENALLIAMSGATTGKVAFNRTGRSLLLNQRVGRLEPLLISTDFVRFFFETIVVRNLSISFGSAIPNLSAEQIYGTVLPLPPLAEQKRIVAKVDELMALCDRLEAQQLERETQHVALARASLARFADAPTPENLNLLFHKSFDVAPSALRKSILTLAVQGKLVPQDPNDEPAEELIRRVAAALPEKPSENPFLGEIEPSITTESEYELPVGWSWLPLGHIGIWATGCGFPTQYQGETEGEFLFCKVSDMNLPGNEVEIRTTVNSINADVMKMIRARANPVGTVIFPKIGGAIATHKRRLVIQPTIIDNNCSGIKPIGLTDDQWLLRFMRSLDLTKYQSGTSVPAVSQGSLDPIRIGLPPLAEQRRIVAKVDQLMALVDRLESQLATSRATAAKLLEAVVAELTTQP